MGECTRAADRLGAGCENNGARSQGLVQLKDGLAVSSDMGGHRLSQFPGGVKEEFRYGLVKLEMLLDIAAGRKMAPKGVHILNLSTYKCVTLHG